MCFFNSIFLELREALLCFIHWLTLSLIIRLHPNSAAYSLVAFSLVEILLTEIHSFLMYFSPFLWKTKHSSPWSIVNSSCTRPLPARRLTGSPWKWRHFPRQKLYGKTDSSHFEKVFVSRKKSKPTVLGGKKRCREVLAGWREQDWSQAGQTEGLRQEGKPGARKEKARAEVSWPLIAG